MQIKTFNNEEEANHFFKTLAPSETNSLQYHGGTYVIFYDAVAENYEDFFIDRMIHSLTTNIFHENIRKATIDAEVATRKKQGTNKSDYDDAVKRQKEAENTIEVMEAKLNAIRAWKAASTLKTSQ